jgi:hypothetical protein
MSIRKRGRLGGWVEWRLRARAREPRWWYGITRLHAVTKSPHVTTTCGAPGTRRRCFEDLVGRAGLVAGGKDAGLFDGFGEAAAHGAEGEGGDFGFGLDREIGGLAGEFAAAVEGQSGFAKEFGGKAHVFGAIDAPEPQLFFIALEKIQGLFELGHGAIEGGSQEKDVERPGMARIAHLNADAVLSALISLHAAAVGVAYRSGASGNFGFHRASEHNESARGRTAKCRSAW